MRVLVVDNYDSFVFNLVQYLAQLGADATVRRNDEVDLDELADVDGVLVSPGPGTPERAGASHRRDPGAPRERELPLLGVCLGHQAIGVAFGGVVERAPELLHGKTSLVHHDGAGVLAGLPDPFTATRYHSLHDPARHRARRARGHRPHRERRRSWRCGTASCRSTGVQFHPESVLTDGGHRMLANWMAEAGHPVAPGSWRRSPRDGRARRPRLNRSTVHPARASALPFFRSARNRSTSTCHAHRPPRRPPWRPGRPGRSSTARTAPPPASR